MKTRILGKDLSVSAVGLGCMGFSRAYGLSTEKNEAIRGIQEAVIWDIPCLIQLRCIGHRMIRMIMKEKNQNRSIRLIFPI